MFMDAVIDSCVFHEWASTSVLAPYMPSNWAHILDQPMTSVKTQRPYFNPLGITAASPTTDGAVIPVLDSPATDFEALRERIFSGTARERVVLSYDDGLMSTTFPAHYVARAVVQAANDWTAAEWLARDERLYGLIMISTMLPADAAAEIRRSGANNRMVGIAMGGNGLSRPFGHPVYHPIYEAAVELGLPLVLQIGPETDSSSFTPFIAGGTPATFGEWSALSWQSNLAHMSSMIMNGVFDLYPTLKVLLIGGGVLWVPGQLWRLDAWHRTNTREGFLSKLPSEYFAEHFRLATYQIESVASADALRRGLETIPDVTDVLMYTSTFPNRDWQDVSECERLLPADWQSAALRDNAAAFFRWPH